MNTILEYELVWIRVLCNAVSGRERNTVFGACWFFSK